MGQRKRIQCLECKEVLCRAYTFRQHVKRFHPDKEDILIPKKKYDFQCTDCNKNFSHKKTFDHHLRQEHNKYSLYKRVPQNKKCPLCDYTHPATREMLDHFTATHEIHLKSSSHILASLDEMHTWKDKIESETNSRFAKIRGKTLTKGEQCMEFLCHRSGTFNSRGKGLRKLKRRGSNKIEGYCPAIMTVVIKHDGSCQVTFLETHVGHENDISHLFLSLYEREALATKIAQKVPFRNILEEARTSSQNSDPKRIHLITRKDLHNIKRCFHLESVCSEDEPDEEMNQTHSDEEETFVVEYVDEDSISEESTEIVQNLNNNSLQVATSTVSVDEQKRELKSFLLSVVDRIESVEDVGVLEKLNHLMCEVSSLLD